jgi:hypothetical protein
MNEKKRPEDENKNISTNKAEAGSAVEQSDELSDSDLESVSGGGDSGNSSWNPY